MAIQSYRDLVVWQKAMDLVVHCYAITAKFPKSEIYGITSQIRRAAVSIPANIAEGNGIQYRNNYLRHLTIAHGSLMELETHLMISQRLNYVSDEIVNLNLDRCSEIGRMIQGLKRSLESD